jgi:glycosyltransferase involved in cell wall biosynthesis
MNIIVVFTFDVSLESWEKDKILNREVLLYKKLRENFDLNFTFLTFGNEKDDKYQYLFDGLQIIPIYKHAKKSRYKIINFFKSLAVCFRLRKKLLKNNLIKTNQLTGAIVGIFLKLVLKVPLIVRTGYNNYDFARYEKKSSKIIYFYYFLTQISLLVSDSYVVSSSIDKKSLENKFKTKGNIHIFPNWIEKINNSSKSIRYSNKILSIGRLEKQKDYSELIAKLVDSDIELDIIGEGSLKKRLINLSHNLGVKLQILRKVDFDKLNLIYQKYPIFISSSIFEGNPKVVLEAMANGCMVIVKNNINNQEIIKNGFNGILYSEDEDLVKIINLYLNDKDKRSKLVENGYKYLSMNNKLENYCQKEFDLYTKLI